MMLIGEWVFDRVLLWKELLLRFRKHQSLFEMAFVSLR